MNKMKSYRIGKRGVRGFVLSLPQIFLEDNKVQPGDKIDVYRDVQNGKDVLVLVPKKTAIK